MCACVCGDLRSVLGIMSSHLKVPVDQLYTVRPGGTVAQTLRIVLTALGVPIWCELFVGLSWRAYCSMDVYSNVQSCALHYRSPNVVQHLVYDFDERGSPYVPDQTQWWAFRRWQGMGQASDFTDYGPCIRMPPSIAGLVPDHAMQVYAPSRNLSGDVFAAFAAANPQVFDAAFDFNFTAFIDEYFADKGKKGHGKGKCKPQFMVLDKARLSRL